MTTIIWCTLKIVNSGKDRPITKQSLQIGDYVVTDYKKGDTLFTYAPQVLETADYWILRMVNIDKDSATLQFNKEIVDIDSENVTLKMNEEVHVHELKNKERTYSIQLIKFGQREEDI